MTDRATARGLGYAGKERCRTPPIPTPPTTPRGGSVGEAVYLQGRARAALPAQPRTAADNNVRTPKHTPFQPKQARPDEAAARRAQIPWAG